MAASAGSIRAGRAFVELLADSGPLAKGLAAASAKMQAWGASVTAIGQMAFGAGMAAVTAFLGAAAAFARFGDLMGGEDADNAARLRFEFAQLKANLLGLAVTIGSALAPMLSSLMASITEVVKDVTDWMNANRPLVTLLFQAAAAIAGVGLAFMVAGKIIAGVGVVLVVFKGVLLGVGVAIKLIVAALALLLSPIALVVAAVAGLGTAWLMTTRDGEETSNTLARQWEGIKEAAVTAWSGIVDAVMSGDLALAGQIAFSGLKVIWSRTVAALRGAWTGFSGWFLEVWTKVTAGFSLMFSEIWSGVLGVGVKVVAGLRLAWFEFINWLARLWEGFVHAMTVAAIEATRPIPGVKTSKMRAREDERHDNRVKELADNIEAKREQIKRETEDKIGNIEGDRAKRRDDIAWKAKEGLADIERRRRGARAEGEDEIDEAQKKLRDLALAAKQKREQQQQQMKKGGLAIAPGGAAEGTFSAAAAGRMGGATWQERQIQELQKIQAVMDALLAIQRNALGEIKQGGILLR